MIRGEEGPCNEIKDTFTKTHLGLTASPRIHNIKDCRSYSNNIDMRDCEIHIIREEEQGLTGNLSLLRPF
jgi:hypothetical protein